MTSQPARTIEQEQIDKVDDEWIQEARQRAMQRAQQQNPGVEGNAVLAHEAARIIKSMWAKKR